MLPGYAILTQVGLHPIAEDRPAVHCMPIGDGEQLAITNERNIMSLLFTPVLANALYIGGGSVGLLVAIVIVVLLLRR